VRALSHVLFQPWSGEESTESKQVFCKLRNENLLQLTCTTCSIPMRKKTHPFLERHNLGPAFVTVVSCGVTDIVSHIVPCWGTPETFESKRQKDAHFYNIDVTLISEEVDQKTSTSRSRSLFAPQIFPTLEKHYFHVLF
jgi:hypothetical protein